MATKKASKQKTLGVNPWLSMWTQPRKTIQAITDTNPRHRFLILSFLYGLPMLLHIAQNNDLGASFTTLGIVIVALVLATFAGMLGIVIGTALVHWTGKWIGGKGSFINLRAAVSWSNVPNVFAIIMWGFLIYAFQEQIFIEDFEEMPFAGGDLALYTTALTVQGITAVWSFIMLVKGIGQVQKFSAWKGVLNVLIPFFMVGIFIWIVMWVFWIGNGVVAS